MDMEENTTGIAIIPSPGFSHLFPILEFSKRLLHFHPHFHVTCIIPTLDSPSSSSISYLQSLPSNINPIFLPPIPKQHIPPPDTILAVQIQLTVTHSLPYIHEELKSLASTTNGLTALITDIFALEALDFASEFNILSYIYLPQAAMVASLYYHSLMLDESISSEYRDLPPESFEIIPGCVPLQGTDLPVPFQDRSSLAYKQFLQRSKRFHQVDGVLVNTFLELETETIRALQEEIINKGKKNNSKPQIFPVGPIIQSGSNSRDTNNDKCYCLTWLDKQSPRSVVYVSFGSGGTLSQEQINELAFGFEKSKKKFLWIVRAPSNIASAAYLDTVEEDPLDFLPKGFIERTKDQGLVVPSWAPQIEILSHSSIGGFLSHCGWNSILESIMHGVPLITWPLFAEQRMNAVLVTNGVKMGVSLRTKENENENGLVVREEIAKVIERLMMEGGEGEEIRKRIKVLKDAASNAVKEDGDSTKTLSLFALNLRAK